MLRWNTGASILCWVIAVPWISTMSLNLPPIFSIPWTVTVGFMAGGLWVAVAGFLKVCREVWEVISTIRSTISPFTWSVTLLMMNHYKNPPSIILKADWFQPTYRFCYSKLDFILVGWLLLPWLCYLTGLWCILPLVIVYGLPGSMYHKNIFWPWSAGRTGRNHGSNRISSDRLFQPADMSMLGPGFIGVVVSFWPG